MKTGYNNFEIFSNATFEAQLTWRDANKQPIDLTGWDAQMQIRSSAESATVLLELTVTNGRITLGDAAGTIDLSVDASEFTAIDWDTGVYDLLLISPATRVVRLLNGKIVVIQGVTR